ncbi:MAG TPA: (2Fe-2S)-binding protein [Chloroflexota bacterium]|jgi:aerobic-type carbon monoxide dehydrogenase small subunit (CoxS/CutS family)
MSTQQSVLRLHINGAAHELEVANHQTLLEALRDQVGLTSVREGCGIGVCGACTVLLDGRPVSSCLTLAVMAEDHEILTVEGLGLPGSLHPLQEAFIAEAGFQCSYCTPGFILTAKALLDERPSATDDEIREYLSGNLCRCGSYVKIIASVREAISHLRS